MCFSDAFDGCRRDKFVVYFTVHGVRIDIDNWDNSDIMEEVILF